MAAHQRPVYVLDGNVLSDTASASLNPHSIASIEILRASDPGKICQLTKRYGPNAVNGVIVIVSKK
jgi:hypothetical protein